jgi:hypothetical protein
VNRRIALIGIPVTISVLLLVWLTTRTTGPVVFTLCIMVGSGLVARLLSRGGKNRDL